MKELTTKEAEKASGAGLSIFGGGGGNPGGDFSGSVGVGYQPEGSGFTGSVSENFAHVNGNTYWSEPSYSLGYIWRW